MSEVSGAARMRGVLSPVVTPFDTALRPDARRFVRHCRWLLDQGVGLAVVRDQLRSEFAVGRGEARAARRARRRGRCPPARMMPGTGCCALPDSVELTRRAVGLGCAGVLMLPPFYYKAVSDDGLFRNYAEIIERVGDRRLRIYLYHIPPVSQVPISLALIERLLRAYPGTIAGIKDSSGDWNNTAGDARALPAAGLRRVRRQRDVPARHAARRRRGLHHRDRQRQPGADRAAGARLAGAPTPIAQQAALDAVRAAFQKFPMIPALKADDRASRAPIRNGRRCARRLVELTEAQRRHPRAGARAASASRCPDSPREASAARMQALGLD